MCSICNQELKGFLNISLECGHTFHKKCIEHKDKCPECKFETKLKPHFGTQKELNDYYFNFYDISICDAAQENQLDIVKDMVKNGVSICSCAVSKSAYLGHTEMVKYLVEHNAQIDDQALTAASLGNHAGLVRYLLEHNAPKSARPLNIALHQKNEEIATILVSNGIVIDQTFISSEEVNLLTKVKNSLKNKKKKIKKKINDIGDEILIKKVIKNQ